MDLVPKHRTGLFFFAALGLLQAFTSLRLAWQIVAGALLGATLLAHTAPALILTVTVLAAAVAFPRFVDDARPITHYARAVLVIGSVALAVATPYLLPLAREYRFSVQNTAPMNSVGLSIERMVMGLVSLRVILATVGLLALLRGSGAVGGRRQPEAVLFVCLMSVCTAWLGWGVFYQILLHLGVEWMQIVPEYHFHMYFKSFEAVLAGLGLSTLLSRWQSRWLDLSRLSLVVGPWRPSIAGTIVCALLVA